MCSINKVSSAVIINFQEKLDREVSQNSQVTMKLVQRLSHLILQKILRAKKQLLFRTQSTIQDKAFSENS